MVTQYGVSLPPGTARLTPGQPGASKEDPDFQELLSFANDRETFSSDPEFDNVIGAFKAMEDREEQIKDYGSSVRKWYLTDTPRDEVMEYLEPVFGKNVANEMYKATEESWKPYREMYKVAGEYARGDRTDPGYVQELDQKDKELFYAFMIEQATPKQRTALGKTGENWMRGMGDVWDSFEEGLSKLTGMEFVKTGTTLGMPNYILRFKQDDPSLEVEAAVAEAAETRRRIRRVREAGDPVESESLLGQGVLDIARMGPRLAGGMAAAEAGGPAGSIAFWTAQIAPDLEDEMVDMGVPREKAATWSLLAAIPSAAVEASQVEKLTPGASQAIKRGALGYLAGYAKKYGKNWIEEVGEEGLQFVIEETAKHAAAAGQKNSPDIDFPDIMARGLEEMKRAGVSLSLLTAAGHLPGLRGVGAAHRLQKVYNQALVVSEKSTNPKMKQYADTLITMIDNQTPIDKKSRGLAERVMKEADAIKLKEAISVVSEARLQSEEKVAEEAKQPVAEPQKPVEETKPEPKPEVKEEAKPAPAPKEAVTEAPTKERPKPKPKPAKKPVKAEPRTKPVPPPTQNGPLKGLDAIRAAGEARMEAKRQTEAAPAAPAETGVVPGPVALKKRARARKAKTGRGIRRVALEIDNALKKGTITQPEAEVLYEDLGRRAVELEQDPKDKRDLTNVKESLRKRLRAIKGIEAPAAVPARAAPPAKAQQAAERTRQKRLTKLQKDMERQVKNLKKENRSAENRQDFAAARRITAQIEALERDIADVKERKKRPGAVTPQRPARVVQQPKPKSVAEPQVPIKEPVAEPKPRVAEPPQAVRPEAPAPAQFDEGTGPRMGEEVLERPKPAREATLHPRADAMAELELDEKTDTDLAEDMTDRGLNPQGMNREQMVDAILDDAVASGEISPIVEGVQPEVEGQREKVPAHRRPMSRPATEVADVVGMNDNEVRMVRDEINSAMNSHVTAHGARDVLRKHLAQKGVSSPQSIIRNAAETGDYRGAVSRLRDVYKALRSLGKKSKKWQPFRSGMQKGINNAIEQMEAMAEGRVPPIIQEFRRQIEERDAARRAQEKVADQLRAQMPEVDAKIEAAGATVDQKQDVAFGQEEGAVEASIESQKNAEAAMRLAEREADAIGGAETFEQLAAQQILDMDNQKDREAYYTELERDQGVEFADKVRAMVDNKSTIPDKTRNAVEHPNQNESFAAGIPMSMFGNMWKTVSAAFERMSAKLIKGYRLQKARNTIFEQLRRTYGSAAYTQEVARRAVIEQFSVDDYGKPITPEDAKAVSQWREQPTKYSLPKNLTKVGEQVNEFYKVIEGMWKEMGMGTFPDSRIKANDARIEGLKERLADYREGSTKYDAFLREIDSLEQENQRLRQLRYHRHIILKKPIAPEQAVAMDADFQRGSHRERLKTTPTEALGREYETLDQLEAAGFEVEWDFRVAMADIFSYVSNKKMIHEFHENIVKADPSLARPAKEAPEGWVELPGIEPYNRRRYKSGSANFKVIGPDGKMRNEKRSLYKFKGEKWKVHPFMAEALRDFTESASHSTSVGKVYDAINNMMKQLKFYNPLIMTINNMQQGLSLSGFKFPLKWAEAFRSVMNRDDFYLSMLEGDLFSTPSDIPLSDYNETLRVAFEAQREAKTALGRFFNRAGIKSFGDIWKLAPVHPQSASYKMLREATWWFDRVARVASVKAQMEGFKGDGQAKLDALNKAIIRSRMFHGDYNLLRREPSKWLRRFFLTPAYKTAMWYKLFPQMIKDIPSDPMPVARTGLTVAATTAALALLGYSWEDKYRFIKKAGDEDDEKEHVIQMFGPFSEPFKVYGRFTAGYEEGGLTKGAERVLYNNLAAIPKAAYSLFARNRNWKGDRIVTPGAPVTQQQQEVLTFLFKETLPWAGQIDSAMFDSDQSKFDALMNVASITMYTRDSSKRTWYKHKLDQRQKDLRAWAKEKAKGDPDLSSDYNEAAAKRFADYAIALSDTLKQYEARLETAKKGTAWQKIANQFDKWSWAHSKIDPGNPTLIEEKSLVELRAVARGPIRRKPGEKEVDFIERIMRKTFARTFLEQVADHE